MRLLRPVFLRTGMHARLLASSAVEYWIAHSAMVRTREDTSVFVFGRVVAGSAIVPHRHSYAVALHSFGTDVNRMGLTLDRRGTNVVIFSPL